jgi:hypothetical protein
MTVRLEPWTTTLRASHVTSSQFHRDAIATHAALRASFHQPHRNPAATGPAQEVNRA